MNRALLLIPCMLVGSALTLPAQWVEVGDAGQLPNAAQVPVGGGPLVTIVGSVATDADMYLIRIDDPSVFDATTVNAATAFDTQLFLFRVDGQGVAHNDDDPATSTSQSRITGVFVPSPGLYCLALTPYIADPWGQGKLLWNNSPYNVERKPDGPGRLEAVGGWSSAGSPGGGYMINLLGCSFPGKDVVLPDNHHLTESANQVGGTGSTSWWRTGGGHFQVLYEGSHFRNAGVGGPIFIEKIAFRGEDGEPNLGGQFWNGVTVQLAETTLTAATMYTTFAMNQFPPPPDMTILGPPGIFNSVTVWTADGSYPNNTNIVLDLTTVGAVIPYDPTGPFPNLLIDVILPSAAMVPPSVGSVMAMQDTSGSPAFIRGAGVTAAAPFAPTGNPSNVPPVVHINFQGSGGTSKVIPAQNEFYGSSCGGRPCSFYQTFLNGEVFDLTGLTLTPDNVAAPNFYTVTAGAPGFDPTQVLVVPSSISDDGTVAHPLGFTFNYPGGSTGAISACTNGFVWLNGASTSTDASPTVGELLGVIPNPARLAACWYDFHAGRNVATHPNSGLHVLTDTSGGLGNAVCYVTWFNVGIYDSVSGPGVGGHAVHDLQMVLDEATGMVEFRYGSMPLYSSSYTTANPSNPAIVGFSRGQIGGVTPCVDPQSRDLSLEMPFSTAIEGAFGNIGQTATATPAGGGIAYSGRMFAGQVVTWDANTIPPTALIGVQMIDFVASRPGVGVPILAPRCVISTSLNPFVLQFFPFPAPAVNGTAMLWVPPGYSGLSIVSQFVVFDASGQVLTSNALKHTIGLY